jgi:hypothetical protein
MFTILFVLVIIALCVASFGAGKLLTLDVLARQPIAPKCDLQEILDRERAVTARQINVLTYDLQRAERNSDGWQDAYLREGQLAMDLERKIVHYRKELDALTRANNERVEHDLPSIEDEAAIHNDSLFDATACCPAFQLGACEHTEVEDNEPF